MARFARLVGKNAALQHCGLQTCCHHLTGRVRMRACGGCYARLTTALRRIAETGDVSIAAQVLDVLQAEGGKRTA